MGQLISLILLFLAASIFNVNEGMALTPIQVLVINFAVAIFAVFVILLDPEPAGLMQRPPRDVTKGIANRSNIFRWLIYGGALFIAAFLPLVIFGDQLVPGEASDPVTMTYIVLGLGTIGTAVAMRRDPEPGFTAPWGKAIPLIIWPIVILVASTELGFLQNWIDTTELDGTQWLISIGLALFSVLVVEVDKVFRRRRLAAASPALPATVTEAVAPARARCPTQDRVPASARRAGPKGAWNASGRAPRLAQ